MMKTKIQLIIIISAVILVACQRSTYVKTENGILISFKGQKKDACQTLKVEIISDDIIHVMAGAQDHLTEGNSLAVLNNPDIKPAAWKVEDDKDILRLITSKLMVEIVKKTGEITFLDIDGNVLLQELPDGGKRLEFANNAGAGDYRLYQAFKSPEDEAFYGLGQHQNGEMNYKGLNIDLTQYNTVAVVPFLVSSRNYGILWDNYSRTKFGDPRDYKELSELTLYDREGHIGGLTATYYRNIEDKDPLVSSEKVIHYKYINDLDRFPKDFSLETGIVTWEGDIESQFSGKHFFELYSSGYIKVWIDDEKVIDSWRQQWNPWKNKFELNMEKEKKYHLKIEWIPDGGEAYIAMSWLEALPEKEQGRLAFFSESGKQIDYYFIHGNTMDDVISGYRKITGKAPIMPEWAMGFWQSRERYHTQKEILDVVKEFRKRKIPLDNIVIDWHYWKEDEWGDHEFDPDRFPNPEQMIDELHRLNAHVMISVWPKFYVGTKNYDIMNNKGYLYQENIRNKQKDWVGPGYVSTFYDAFDADARALFWSDINKKLYGKDIDAWWLDATEPDILSNSSIEERKKLMGPTALGPSTAYFNAYSLMNTKGVYEGQLSENPNSRIFILTRSAFAGQQRFAAATWSGDVVSTWEDLHYQISAGLNMSVSGIPYWTMDIGGFSLERRYERPDKKDREEWRELNTRWYQFGAFCPLFRSHGQFPYREIYHIAPQDHIAYKTMLYYDKLRYRLMPYIYTLAGMTYHKDYTIMRPLIMDFTEDTEVYNIDDQYMFGPSLLVCPVYEYKAASRDVYLPASNAWYDFYTGEYLNGGQTITAHSPVSKIPVFVKEGAIVPLGPQIHFVGEKEANPLTLYVYGGKNGEFTLYEDEGINYNYKEGKYSEIPITYNDAEKTIIFDERKGEFNGMLKSRTFKIIYIHKDNEMGFDTPVKQAVKTIYDGTRISVKL